MAGGYVSGDESCGNRHASRAETLILCGVAGVFGENGVVLLKE